ncbi:hypothetical protein PUN28_001202 [Cardiocondyla obscurior]|uniref:Uncharacterized protein n=1 Tax=Cardiocondyla obscurior TaxID=286306 RepID=A0AAW2H3T0_9HYME
MFAQCRSKPGSYSLHGDKVAILGVREWNAELRNSVVICSFFFAPFFFKPLSSLAFAGVAQEHLKCLRSTTFAASKRRDVYGSHRELHRCDTIMATADTVIFQMLSA